MAKIEVTLTDNSELVKNALESQIEAALRAVGMTAEAYAKEECPVDTGRLRNSITHDIDVAGRYAVIGSNVEYAAIVELGGSMRKAQPYLRPAITNHLNEYQSIVQSTLKGNGS